MNTLIWLAVIVAIYFFLKIFDPKKKEKSAHTDYANNNADSIPKQLLDLDKTTVADRQRAYHRGYRTQLRYDILQRRAEIAGDTVTLEAIRTNTYNGPLPELEDEKPVPTCNPNAGVHRLQYFGIKDKGYHVSVWPNVDGYAGLDYIEFNIAGMSHCNNIGDYLGEHIGTLEAEPTNKFDSKAIKILAEDGHHVGYVPKDMTASVREFTALPCTCFFYICINNKTYYSDAYINRDN